MNVGDFAQDPTDVVNGVDFFAQKIAHAPELHWFALTDGAFDHEAQRNLSRFRGVDCYDTPECEALLTVSPQLIALQPDERARMVLTAALRHCSARPMLSVVASRVPAHQLVASWQASHWVQTADGQRLLLRFADTRVLPVLQEILAPAQWAALTGALAHWFYIDRHGQPRACTLAPPDTEAVDQIELSPDQLNHLVDASEPDTMFAYLAEHMADLIPGDQSHSDFYGRIAAVLTLARAHAIETWGDKMALMTAECLTQGAFRQDPRLMPLLSKNDWAPNALGDQLIAEGLV